MSKKDKKLGAAPAPEAKPEVKAEPKEKGSVVVKYGRDGQLSREFDDKKAAAEFAKKRETVHGDKVSVE